MDIYPQDLGREACRQVGRHRLWYVGSDAGDAPAPRRPRAKPPGTPLRVYFFWSLVISVAAAIWLGFSFWITLFVCVIGSVVLHPMACLPGGASRQAWSRPDAPNQEQARLTVQEVAAVQTECHDPLLVRYLELVRTALTLPAGAGLGAEAERGVRDALRALGRAVENLPLRTPEALPRDAGDLRAASARMEADAQGEADPVIAASLLRRAEALRRQAETLTRVGVILRRHQALRDELGDQMGALRTSLSASALGQAGGGLELAGLAAHVQQVAREADAVTAARVEVDALGSRAEANAAVPASELRIKVFPPD